MLAHLRAIAWLQLRLVKHSASRDFRWLGAFAWALQLILALVGCGFLIVVATAAGFLAFNGENAWVLMIVLDSVIFLLLLVRMIMLLVELNESDFIDTEKLLFLPVRLRTLFAINFVVRNFSGLLILSVPPLVCLCVSLSFMHGPQMLIGIPLGLAAIFAIAGAFDCLREWVLTFGESRSKMVVNLSIVLMSVLLAALASGGAFAKIRSESEAPLGVSEEKLAALGESVEKSGGGDPSMIQVRDALVRVNTWIPLGWLPLGLYRLTVRDYTVALFGTIGLMCIGALAVAADYRFILKRYRDPSGGASVDKKKSKPASRWTRFTLQRLDTPRSAVAGLTCLIRARSFTVRSSTWFYVIAAVIACTVPAVADVSSWQSNTWSGVTPFATAILILFFSLALSNNIFGQDRSGFQVLVLMPVSRQTYLLCKNTVNTVLVVAWVAVLMAPCILIFRPHLATVVAALLMTLQAQLVLSVIGNGVSIAFPFRLKDGVLDQPAQPLAAMVPGFVLMLAAPVVFGPIVLTAVFGPLAGWVWKIEGAWISLFVALLFLVATACAYAASIPTTASFLQSREMRMLEILASDRE